MNIFVIGTEPKIGKTLITSALASIMQSLSYKTAVYKPIQLGAFEQNGFMVAPDIAFVKQFDPYLTTECTYLLKNFMLPVLSSEMEKVKINPKVILKDFSMLSSRFDVVVTDGTGELMTPIAPRFTVANLVGMLNSPVVLVCRADEKNVNETILTVNHAKAMGIKVNGIIINRYPSGCDNMSIKSVPRLIEEYTETSVIGVVKNLNGYDELTPSAIIDNVLNGVDIEKVFGIKIPKLEI